MSSIESYDSDKVVAALFDDVLVPLAERRRAAGTEAFPLKPDAAANSYYVRRPKPAMAREDFTSASCEGFEDFERRLAAMWQARGRTELVAAVPRFGAAARAAYALGAEEAEVSPFIYVMF